MPLGKQAAAYTLASSFAMVAAKCRMLLPTPFQFSSPQLYLLVLLLKTLLPPFAKEVGAFVFPIPCGIGEKNRTTPPKKCAGA